MMHSKIEAQVVLYNPIDLECDLIGAECKAESIEVMAQMAEEKFQIIRNLYGLDNHYGEWRIIEVFLREIQDVAHSLDDAIALIRNNCESARGA